MSDDTKPKSSTHEGLTGSEGQVWSAEEGDTGAEDGPLILGEASLAKKGDGEPSSEPGSGEPVPVGEVSDDVADPSPRRGVLSRLFRRDRSGPVEVKDPASEEESDGDTERDHDPEPDHEAPPKGSRGWFRRHRPQRPSELMADEGAGLPDAQPPASEVETEEPAGSEVVIPPGTSQGTKRTGKPKKRGFPPIQVLIGWIEESSRKDVLEHARGFAQDHVETLDTSWIAMAEFRGGTLFEIHEGGNGQAYLPDLIEELSRDPEQVLWVPSGTKLNRVVTFSLVEGRPFSMMLNEADSARVRESGQAPMERSGKMRRLSPRGNAVLVVGATFFALAMGALSASAYLAASIDQQPIPALSYNPEILPHGQIVSLSSALREDRWVSRIVFENGAWRAEFETFDELVLPENTDEAQRLINEAVSRDAILQQERDRKIEELITE